MLLKFFREKWINRVRQYGLWAAGKQVFFACLRPIYKKSEDIVIVVPNHGPIAKNLYPDVKPLSLDVLNEKQPYWRLTPDTLRTLQVPLEAGCKGFMIEKNGKLAGYSFIQPKGRYKFGYEGILIIPANTEVLKNLFIFPEFRGLGFNKQFNAARVASIPNDCYPLGFVRSDNRYSIRNLKAVGFKEILRVKRTTFIGRYSKLRITILDEHEIIKPVIAGLEVNSKN